MKMIGKLKTPTLNCWGQRNKVNSLSLVKFIMFVLTKRDWMILGKCWRYWKKVPCELMTLCTLIFSDHPDTFSDTFRWYQFAYQEIKVHTKPDWTELTVLEEMHPPPTWRLYDHLQSDNKLWLIITKQSSRNCNLIRRWLHYSARIYFISWKENKDF